MSSCTVESCFALRPSSLWQKRYGHRHGYFRVACDPALPNGRRGRVTLYQRGRHAILGGRHRFILSWCANGHRSKERFVGDLFAAVARADEINQAIAQALLPKRKTPLGLAELVERFVHYQQQRAEAGEISPKTPERYRSALEHLIAFARNENRPAKSAWMPNRELALRFRAYLQSTLIGASREANRKRLLSSKGVQLILATARALVRWAIQDGLLPPSAAAAFMQTGRDRASHHTLSAVPVDTEEIARLISAATATTATRTTPSCGRSARNWIGSGPSLPVRTNSSDAI